MNEKQSIVKKTESALDDLLDLWRRRKIACIIVLLVIILPAGFTLYQQFVAVPKLEDQVSALQTAGDEAKRERDKAELKLAPFLAAADRRFPDSPADKRLDLLLSRLDKAITDVQSAARMVSPERSLDPRLKQALIDNLKSVAPLDVEITCVLGDTEGLSLASQLKDVFEQAGWKVNGVNQAVFTAPVKHLVLTFGKEPSREIQRTLVPLFDSFGYPRETGLNKEIGESSLKIVVGSK
jgi:hypothetical protein